MPPASRSLILWLRRGFALLLAAALLTPVLVARGTPGESPPRLPRVESQRVELLGRVGGLVTAGIPLSSGSVLMAEGSSLVRLELTASSSRVLDQVDLDHGIILDVVETDRFIYALTEEGVLALRSRGRGLPQIAGFMPGSGQALAARDGVVVIAAREAGLRVLEVAGNGEVETATVLPLGGPALDVELSPDGQTAYVAGGGSGVYLVDLSDPAAPRQQGALPQLTPADAVGTAGSLIIVGSEERAVVADPAGGSEAVVGVYSPLRGGRRIAMDAGHVYVADAADGLKILRLVATDHLVQVYGETNRPALDLWLEGHRLYVLGPDGLRVLAVDDPPHPREVALLPLPGEPQGLALGIEMAYAALGPEGLAEIDLTDPAAPRLRRLVPLPGTTRDVLLDGRVLYAAAGEAGIIALDLDSQGSGTPREPFALPGPALDLAVRGNSLFVAGGEAGLIGVDLSYPGTTSLAGVLPPADGETIESIMISGKRAYLGAGDSMVVADVSYANSMGRLARVREPAHHIASRGVYLYALHDDQIAVYDARATAEPVFLRRYTSLGHVSHITSEGERVYLSGAGDGPPLVVLGLGSPDAPVELDSLPGLGEAHRAWPHDGEVWLARGYGGLARYTFGEGGVLVPRGEYSVSGEVGSIAAEDSRLLVGGRAGWALLGAGDGNLPAALARAPDALPVRGLSLSDGLIGVAAGERGVALYGLDAAGHPALVARREVRGAATGIAVDDRFAYVADADGLAIYDNRYLQPVTSVAMPAPASDIVRRGTLAYFPLADGQLAVVDLADPTGGLRVHSIYRTDWPADLLTTPDGETVYVLTDERLTRLRTSQLDEVISVGFSNLPEPALRSGFAGDWLWTLQPGEAIHLYNPEEMPAREPEHRRAVPTRGLDMVFDPPFAYLALGETGLAVIDVTVPEAEIVFYAEPVNAVYREGDVLFAVGRTLTAWDVRQRAAPVLLSELPLAAPGRHIDPAPDGLLVSLATGMALVSWDGASLGQIGQLVAAGQVNQGVQMGDRAFLALHNGGLLVVDVSNPAQPVRLYSYTSPAGQFVNDLMPLGEGALLVSWEGGVEALDVSQVKPTPRLLGTLPAGGAPALDFSLSVDGMRGALALGDGGVVLLDLSTPDSPQVTGYVDTPGEARRVALDSGSLYVADGTCGLRVVDVADPSAPRERGYWLSSYASDVSLSARGDIYLAEANQLLTLRYDADAPPELPPIPQFPEPFDRRDGVPLDVDLAWGPEPSPCNAMAYNVHLGVTNDPPFIGQVQGSPMLRVADLDALRTYYWRVDVTDRQGDTIEGPVWRFTTAVADYPDSFPPAPPPLTDRLQQDAAIPVLLTLAALVTIAAGALAWRRRRAARTDETPDWTYQDED